MNDVILTIGGVPVFVCDLPSGDMKVWHPYNEHVRHIVEPICRGRGRWHPHYKNWVVFAQFKDLALVELRIAAGDGHA